MQLAEKAGMHRQGIAKLEMGRSAYVPVPRSSHKVPDLNATVHHFLRLLATPCDWLLFH
jgi:hypothetical protein